MTKVVFLCLTSLSYITFIANERIGSGHGLQIRVEEFVEVM
jgi:hypothetical protein